MAITKTIEMTYELAKQLEDAGLEIWDHEFRETARDPKTNFEVMVPTLSELIEALGDNFLRLTRMKEMLPDKTLSDRSSFCAEALDKTIAMGDTPDTALAKLYLALKS